MKLLFDIGGTNMRLAGNKGNKLGKIITEQTPKSYADAIAKFRHLSARIAGNEKISLTVGGVPRFAKDKLTFWHTHPVVKEISKITKSKVILENDAALAGLGEAVYGAGIKSKIMGYLTFSTGFGGVRIINKKIDVNAFGFEPKMQIANFDLKTRKFSSLSLSVTGRGLKNRFHIPAEHIKDKKILSEIEQCMHVAINNAVTFWSPDTLVVGGAVGLDKKFSQQAMQKFVSARFKTIATPKIIKAKLGQHSGLWGALALSNK